VVLAQVTIELAITFVVHSLTLRQEPALQAWIEQTDTGTLSNPRQVALLNALLAPSKDAIDGDPEFWADFKAHIERRNMFIHRGRLPTAEDARASVDLAHRFLDRLLDLTSAAAKNLDMTAQAKREMALLNSFKADLDAKQRGAEGAETPGPGPPSPAGES